MAFYIESYNDGKELIVKLVGNVDERADFSKIPFRADNRLILDLVGVTLLNSVGLRTWVLWARELARKDGIFLRNCPPSIVHQMNILEGFLPLGATVESFQVPYHCESCGQDNSVTLERPRDFIEASADQKERVDLPATIPCTKCGESCEADIIPTKYLRFLRRKSAP